MHPQCFPVPVQPQEDSDVVRDRPRHSLQADIPRLQFPKPDLLQSQAAGKDSRTHARLHPESRPVCPAHKAETVQTGHRPAFPVHRAGRPQCRLPRAVQGKRKGHIIAKVQLHMEKLEEAYAYVRQ